MTADGNAPRRSQRARGKGHVDYHVESESDIQSDSDDDRKDKQLFYGVKMRAADPQYINHGDDSNRSDILLTMAQVKELITTKLHSVEEVLTVWLTTTEMGFSLTDEPNAFSCPKDVREGKVSGRYLAPVISEFVTSTLSKTGIGTGVKQEVGDVWREVVSLHQRWGKVNMNTEGDTIRMQACRDANTSRLFTSIAHCKNLPWEKDSIARAAYDPAHIPDCNVQATIGQHFLFSEPIPKAGNGRGK